MFSLTFIFLALVVLLDSQDSTTEIQKAVETSDVALGEHYLPEEVSGIEVNEAGKGCFKKKKNTKPHNKAQTSKSFFSRTGGSDVFICS